MSALTDRELLELAAKASGADWVAEEDGRFEILSEIGGVSGYWNPLTDDGDALRLAVKLGLQVDCSDGSTAVFFDPSWADKFLACEAHESDPYAATRRAIVRAAAALTQGA